MSRTRKPKMVRWRNRGFYRRADRKSERHAMRQNLHLALLVDPDVDSLEVLADFHEEHGRLDLAEKIRAGHDLALPATPGGW